MVYPQHPQRVTRGRSASQDLLPPPGLCPVLFASRWADQVLAGSPHQSCRNSIARTQLTQIFKEKPAEMKTQNWGGSLLSAAVSQSTAHSCGKHHMPAEFPVPAGTWDKSQEGLQGACEIPVRRGPCTSRRRSSPQAGRGAGKGSGVHRAPWTSRQLNSTLTSQFSEGRASTEHAAARLPHGLLLALENTLLPLQRCFLFTRYQLVNWPHERRHMTTRQVFSWMRRGDLKETLKTNLSSSAA